MNDEDEYNENDLNDEINRIEYEMNIVKPDGQIRTEFIETTNAENIKSLIKSLTIAHGLLKKYTGIINIQQANIIALYDRSVIQYRIIIGLSVVVFGLLIKTIIG
jgi:hypothetical protein